MYVIKMISLKNILVLARTRFRSSNVDSVSSSSSSMVSSSRPPAASHSAFPSAQGRAGLFRPRGSPFVERTSDGLKVHLCRPALPHLLGFQASSLGKMLFGISIPPSAGVAPFLSPCPSRSSSFRFPNRGFGESSALHR